MKKCNLYVCTTKPLTSYDHSVNLVKMNKTLLRHNRLGHMSQKGLKLLKTSEIMSELDFKNELPICETCVMGKQHKVSFSTNISHSVLEYLHVDV